MLFFMVDIQIDSSSSDDILNWVTHVRGWDFDKYFSMSVAVWCYKGPYHSSTMPSTTPHPYEGQDHSSTMHPDSGKPSIMVQHMAQLTTSFRTTTPSTATTGRTTTEQVNPVHPGTSCKTLLEHCMHVYQPTVQVCKPGESLALREVKHPLNGRTSVNRLPLMKQDILSQYSSCFEGIGCFPGDPYKFHLKPAHKPA